ncbi:MAG: M48 family metallopeptidase [Planctomycetota bacterium]|nr:M48 family metallopeptidase [Planctomycetota bacterium]
MQVVVLAAIMVALSLTQPSGGQAFWPLHAPGAGTPLALAGYVLGAVLLRRLATREALRAFARLDRGQARSYRPAQALSLAADVWLVAGQALPLVLGYAHWVFQALALEPLPLVAALPMLAPYLAAQAAAWVMQYPFWRATRARSVGPDMPTWSRGQYLAYSFRHNVLFVLAPLSMVFLGGDGLGLAARAGWLSPTALALALPGVWLVVFACSPVLIVRVWRTRPLPAGPLRSKLEAACRRLKLRYRDIRLWQTGGVLANAGVMGLAGPLRYILVSDALLENLSDEQVEAVFAHEAGHILFRHIPYCLLFGLCATAGALGLSALGALAMNDYPPWLDLASLAALGGVFFGGFGYISRRFERQSDVFAAWSVGSAYAGVVDELAITPQGAAIFASALERVGELNGTPPRQYNWRHGSIAARIGYIIWLGSTGGTRRPIDRTVRGLKMALWLAGAIGAAVAAGLWSWGITL